MDAVMDIPFSPLPAHPYPSVYEAAKLDMTHLSGATMADLAMEPTVHLITASPATSKRSSIRMTSNRCSVASTTKSELRHSNQLLIDMLKNIQTELSAHRSIMLDIQHRVSHLEHDSVASVRDEGDQPTALRALEGRTSKRTSRLLPPESQHWWQACQNFARNSEEPMSATEFLRTPKRFSGLDWQYSIPTTKPSTPPATPPEVDELPPLTPTSEEGEHTSTDLETPTKHEDFELSFREVITSTPKVIDKDVEVTDDIKEHEVIIDKKNMPPPPVLQPPPGGKPIEVSKEEVIVAVAPEPVALENPHRYYKGVRSLSTYKALMKNKGTEKEHYVLIHFHKRADLKHLEDQA